MEGDGRGDLLGVLEAARADVIGAEPLEMRHRSPFALATYNPGLR